MTLLVNTAQWEDLDILGPEDGEAPDGEVEDSGFADL